MMIDHEVDFHFYCYDWHTQPHLLIHDFYVRGNLGNFLTQSEINFKLL